MRFRMPSATIIRKIFPEPSRTIIISRQRNFVKKGDKGHDETQSDAEKILPTPAYQASVDNYPADSAPRHCSDKLFPGAASKGACCLCGAFQK